MDSKRENKRQGQKPQESFEISKGNEKLVKGKRELLGRRTRIYFETEGRLNCDFAKKVVFDFSARRIFVEDSAGEWILLEYSPINRTFEVLGKGIQNLMEVF